MYARTVLAVVLFCEIVVSEWERATYCSNYKC